MGQLFAVCSGKGGAGKSTAAVWLSRCLIDRGRRVLLIDADAGLRCLDLMLSVSDRVIFDLGDVLSGRPAEDAIIRIPGYRGLSLLAAPSNEASFAGKPLSDFLSAVLPYYDYVILDLPAGIDTQLYSCLPSTAEFLIIGGFEAVIIRDARAIGEKLDELGFNYHLIINRYDPKLIKRGWAPNLDDIVDSSCCPLLGVIPYDRRIPLFAVRNKPVNNGPALKACARIAARIEGEILPISKPKSIHTR